MMFKASLLPNEVVLLVMAGICFLCVVGLGCGAAALAWMDRKKDKEAAWRRRPER